MDLVHNFDDVDHLVQERHIFHAGLAWVFEAPSESMLLWRFIVVADDLAGWTSMMDLGERFLFARVLLASVHTLRRGFLLPPPALKQQQGSGPIPRMSYQQGEAVCLAWVSWVAWLSIRVASVVGLSTVALAAPSLTSPASRGWYIAAKNVASPVRVIFSHSLTPQPFTCPGRGLFDVYTFLLSLLSLSRLLALVRLAPLARGVPEKDTGSQVP